MVSKGGNWGAGLLVGTAFGVAIGLFLDDLLLGIVVGAGIVGPILGWLIDSR